MRSVAKLAALALVTTALACRGAASEPASAAGPAPEPRSVAAGPAVPARIVAIGDVHGDLAALRAALRLAGAIDAEDRWAGGRLVLVQTGDLLDRGDDEQAIVDLLTRLRSEAQAAGGRVVVLSGNHEVMNVQGDLRYVTEGGLRDFDDVAPPPAGSRAAALLDRAPPQARSRLAAFLPGGAYAMKLADHPVTAVVGDTLFVHGGVLPEHVAYGLARLNDETRRWMRGEGPMPELLAGPSSPIWTRAYADEGACAQLAEVLAAIGAKRMVVGHTVQKDGITSGCGGRLWRIDVGLSRHYGGRPAALELRPGDVRPLVQGQSKR